MTASTLTRKTLVAGISLGVAGLVVALFGTTWLVGLYENASFTTTTLSVLNALINVVTSFCLPLSAALIAASLVMRHLDAVSGARGAGDPWTEDGAGDLRTEDGVGSP